MDEHGVLIGDSGGDSGNAVDILTDSEVRAALKGRMGTSIVPAGAGDLSLAVPVWANAN